LLVATLCGAVALPACGVFDSSDDVDQAVRNLDLATRGVTLNDRVIGTINEAKSSGPTIPAEVAPLVREVKALKEDLRNQEITSRKLVSAIDQQARAIGTLRSLARANNRGQVSINRAQDVAKSISRSLARSQRNYRTVINVSLGVFRREGYLAAQSKRRLARIEVKLNRQRQRIQGINRQNTIVAKAADVEEPEITTQAVSPPPGWTDCGLLQFSVSWAFQVYANSNYCVQAEVIIQQAGNGGILDAAPGTQVTVASGFCTRLSTDPAKPQFECQVEGGFELNASWPDGAGPS